MITDEEITAPLTKVLSKAMPGLHSETVSRLAVALMPVVREIADQRAADLLDELAGVSRNVSGAVLRGRAAALRGKAGR